MAEFVYGTLRDKTFQLKNENQEWTFLRGIFRERFPESMISAALNDESAQVIELTHPCVNSTVISIIYCLIHHKKDVLMTLDPILQDEKVCSGIAEASRYLGIPELALWAHSWSGDMFREFGIITKEDLVAKYWDYMKWAMEGNLEWFFDQGLSIVRSEEVMKIDRLLLLRSTKEGLVKYWRKLVEHGRVDVVGFRASDGELLNCKSSGWRHIPDGRATILLVAGLSDQPELFQHILETTSLRDTGNVIYYIMKDRAGDIDIYPGTTKILELLNKY